MDKYASRVRDADDNQTFLEEHPELLHEHCMGAPRPQRPRISTLSDTVNLRVAGYLLMEALQLGMDEKKAAMKRVVKQKYHIKSLLDFAEARACPGVLCLGALRCGADAGLPARRQGEHPFGRAPLFLAAGQRRACCC
jgi:hypothetical protein